MGCVSDRCVNLVRWLLLTHILGPRAKAATKASLSDWASKVFNILYVGPRLVVGDGDGLRRFGVQVLIRSFHNISSEFFERVVCLIVWR